MRELIFIGARPGEAEGPAAVAGVSGGNREAFSDRSRYPPTSENANALHMWQFSDTEGQAAADGARGRQLQYLYTTKYQMPEIVHTDARRGQAAEQAAAEGTGDRYAPAFEAGQMEYPDNAT